MELPKLVLNRLRCDQCRAYLSCAPVFLKTNGQCVCGRCTSPKKDTLRNEPYEKLAHLMKFPCKYDDDGCSEILSFSNIKAHETVCRFRLYKCRIQPDQCSWHGARNRFYEHCQKMHENDILQNPFELTHITTDIMKTVLVAAFNILFMLQVKVCHATKTLKHFVFLIGDPVLTALYKYDLSIENNAADRVFKTGDVQQTNIQKNKADVIDLKSILRENIRDITITFLISLKTEELTTAKMRCELCCGKNELPVKFKKHQTFFCNNTSTCQLCNNSITGDLYAMHYMEAHSNQTYNADSIFRIAASNDWKWCIIEANFGLTLCKYRLDDNGFMILVYTPLPSHMLSLYNCDIVIINITNIEKLSRPAERKYQCIEDWQVHITNEDVCSYFVNNKVDIQISFTESEN